MRIVMSDVDDDILSQAAVSGNGLIEGSIKLRYQRFEIGSFAAWTNANAWLVAA